MTSHNIGVNLRVSGNCDQGARKYMEDNHVIKFLKKDTDDYEFAYFGVFDGHGGPEASAFCKENLLNEITKYNGFWTDDDEEVLLAIRKGFLDTHHAMWNVVDTWPKTVTGLPSTAGSTATIAIIKQGKLYIGHVGDSALVLGEHDPYGEGPFPVQALCITKEHKPDDPDECLRIRDAGGEVINKSGVPRVVWSRPKTNHKGPVRRSTPFDQIPFLAVARSLGDLWSYDYCTETYVVSPDPDVSVVPLDPSKHRCLIVASDGLWNMLTPEETVHIVMDLEAQFENKIINDPNVTVSFWNNPAEHLVSRALNKWRSKSLKADNTSCIVVLIDPLGPSKLTLLKRKRQALLSSGDITTQPSKIINAPSDISYRSKSHNRNANCSLSDSHIRVTDDSIIEPLREREYVVQSVPQESFVAGSKRDLGGPESDSVNESVQHIFKPPVKWNLRHPVEDSRNQSLNASSRSITCQPKKNHVQSNCSPAKHSNRKSAPVFTKLVETNKAAAAAVGNEEKKRSSSKHIIEQIQHMNNNQFFDSIHEEFRNSVKEDNEGYSDSDYEKTLPKPPPSTPCSDAKKADACGESEGENSLHSSADVTNKAFSLASDESLESPGSSSGDDRPPTPRSAPAKLSSRGRRSHVSRNVKKSLARSGKRLHDFSKLSSVTGTKAAMAVSMSQTPDSFLDINLDKNPNHNVKGHDITKKVYPTVTTAENLHAKNMNDLNQASPAKLMSPARRILNTSRSMSDVTPKNHKTTTRSVSCTGLTPDLSQLSCEGPRLALKKAVGISTSNIDIASQIFSSLKAAEVTDSAVAFALQSRRDNCVTAETKDVPSESCVLAQVEPLKQLNKTVSIRKSRSKRWGNFLRASKLGIDQMFHLGNHHKNAGTTDVKLAATSSGRLECSSSKVISSINTSLSMSKLADVTLSHHLPDVTVSHLADVTLNTSSLTAGDLTNLSALSEDDSMVSAVDLTTLHHSMLDTGLPGKSNKKRKGLLQKTKVTLRRARKAAKKAFFPENHWLFHKPTGGKRRSDEFLPTPELKRRRQLEAEKSVVL